MKRVDKDGHMEYDLDGHMEYDLESKWKVRVGQRSLSVLSSGIVWWREGDHLFREDGPSQVDPDGWLGWWVGDDLTRTAEPMSS